LSNIKKPKGGVTEAPRKAVGKTAQRVKSIEVPVPCPYCEAPKTVPVLFYPPYGKSVNARGCPKCLKVWHPKTLVILAPRATL